MSHQAATTQCTETILVVDDDEWVRRVASRALRAKGYAVMEACDGSAALALAEQYPGIIHLVLSDAIMPGITGGETVRLLKQRRPELKAVFMSGYAAVDLPAHAQDGVATVALAKPFSPHDLQRCIREQLDRPERTAHALLAERDAFHRIADPARLRLVRTTELLDAPRDEIFDRLTRLAAQFLGAPIAFMSLVDEHRDFYVSIHGAGQPLSETRELRGRTFCHYTMQSAHPLVIADARADPDFRRVPTVDSHGVAAYVGVPLVIDGHPIGAMCAIDAAPHAWTASDVQALVDLAAVALDSIELRTATRRDAAARTALRSANLQMLLAKNSAEQANRAKAEFLTHMSHELRTPLNSIIGFTSILSKNSAGTIGPRELKYIERVGFNGHHLLALVDRILDLAKIEQGELQLHCTWVNLEDSVRTVCDSLSVQAATAGVSLAMEVRCGGTAAPLEPVHTDEGKLQQILLNLIGNALKFTPAGGEVRVVLVGSADSGTVHRLEVIDTGIGIAPEAQARVFEAFEQAEEDTAARFGGTGLGLRISRALCESLGFDLTLASVPGHGSTFSVTLAPSPRSSSLEVPSLL